MLCAINQMKGALIAMASNKNSNVRTVNRWEGYYVEDCDCHVCLHWKGVKRGCSLPACCCTEEKREARKHGRIKRKKGFNSWDG